MDTFTPSDGTSRSISLEGDNRGLTTRASAILRASDPVLIQRFDFIEEDAARARADLASANALAEAARAEFDTTKAEDAFDEQRGQRSQLGLPEERRAANKAAIEKARRVLDDRHSLAKAKNGTLGVKAGLLGGCYALLNRLSRDPALKVFPLAPAPKLKRGASAEDCAAEVAGYRAELERRARAIIPPDEAEAEAMASLFGPEGEKVPQPVTVSLGHTSSLERRRKWKARLPVRAMTGVEAKSESYPVYVDATAIFLNFHRREIEAEIRRQIAEHYARNTAPVMPEAQKRSEVKRFRAAILEAERAWAELLWQRVERGEAPNFPAGMDARALLGIAD